MLFNGMGVWLARINRSLECALHVRQDWWIAEKSGIMLHLLVFIFAPWILIAAPCCSVFEAQGHAVLRDLLPAFSAGLGCWTGLGWAAGQMCCELLTACAADYRI